MHSGISFQIWAKHTLKCLEKKKTEFGRPVFTSFTGQIKLIDGARK